MRKTCILSMVYARLKDWCFLQISLPTHLFPTWFHSKSSTRFKLGQFMKMFTSENLKRIIDNYEWSSLRDHLVFRRKFICFCRLWSLDGMLVRHRVTAGPQH